MPKQLPEASIAFPMLGNFTINPKNYILIGNFAIYWYAIIIATGFLLAVMYCSKRAPEFGITADNILDAILIGVPLAIICGRIYYVIFEWGMYKDDLSEIFNIRRGGTAMYGVIIGAVLAMVIYTRLKKIPLIPMVDVVCMGFIMAQSIGRWGNFMNREAFGRETDVFCRMVLTTPSGVSYSVHPTFLYESLWNCAGFVLIHFLSKKRRFDGQVVLMYMTWYGFGRMLIEGLRTDSLMVPGTSIRVSQLVSLILFLTGAALLAYNLLKVKHTPEEMYVNRMAAVIEGPAKDAETDAEAGAENDAENDAEAAEAQDENDAGAEASDAEKETPE